MRVLVISTILAGAMLAVGCYDPELGNTPFRCAPTGKACPDGYRCSDKNICIPEDKKLDASRADARILTDGELQPSKEGPVYLDALVVQSSDACSDKSSEPNNTMATATKLQGQGLIPDWQICYPGDVDHYAVELDMGGKLIVKVEFFHKNGDLDAALLDPDGFVIAQSRSETDDEELSLSTVAKKGTYTIGVYGFAGATNTYDLDLTF